MTQWCIEKIKKQKMKGETRGTACPFCKRLYSILYSVYLARETGGGIRLVTGFVVRWYVVRSTVTCAHTTAVHASFGRAARELGVRS